MSDELSLRKVQYALSTIGIESAGPELIAITAAVIEAVETLGPTEDAEKVEEVVADIAGLGAVCVDCLWSMVRGSIGLLCEETTAASDANSIAEAMANTIYVAMRNIAINVHARMVEAHDAIQAFMDANGERF